MPLTSWQKNRKKRLSHPYHKTAGDPWENNTFRRRKYELIESCNRSSLSQEGDGFKSRSFFRKEKEGDWDNSGTRYHDIPSKEPNERGGYIMEEEFENAVMKYTPEEMRFRKKYCASTRSIFDRRKFEREFDVSKLKLSDEYFKIYKENPHIRQVFANRRELKKIEEPFSKKFRIVNNESGRTKYCRRIGEAKTVEHWGQRKLFISELEFLTNHANLEKGSEFALIYAGAAPGTHIQLLSELFPQLEFFLVDPARFDAKKTDKIHIINDYFDDKMAECFVKDISKDILFISDIRSIDYEMSEEEKEHRVKVDMEVHMIYDKIRSKFIVLLGSKKVVKNYETHCKHAEI
jgi:hypothetical protein